MVVDEVDYLAYGDDAANVLFHVVSERHIKKRAMVLTTNKMRKRTRMPNRTRFRAR